MALFVFVGVRPHAEPPPPGNADLVAHATINLVLGLLALKAFSFPRGYAAALLGLAFVGGAIELLQSFSPNREPAVSDLVANLAGILLAAGVAWGVRKRQ